jgi:ribosomal protein L11 methyltransferase
MRDFMSFRVRLQGAGARERLERLIAETWEAGASGHEECDEADPTGSPLAGVSLTIYAPCSAIDGVRNAAQRAVALADRMTAWEAVEDVDWTHAWSEGLSALEISPRLVVRPSTVAFDLRPQQLEVVVDPGLAFGTGTHASTRLVLDWLCDLASDPECIGPATRVLDVGTGTGLLALAALRLGAGFAVGFDIDPLAPREALRWARHNSLTDGFRAFTGPVAAVAGPPFDLVLANLLRSELLPIAPAVCRQVAAGGSLILSGLLAAERPQVEAALAEQGLDVTGSREWLDETGDHWVSLRAGRPALS